MQKQDFKPNLLERALMFVSPPAALKRYTSRMLFGQLEKRFYDAASNTRRTDGWRTPATSGKSEVANAIHRLRNRARDLERNNSDSKKAIRAIVTNTIGTGIRPTPRSKKGAKESLKNAWANWAETNECDFDGQMTFYGLQRLIMQSISVSGETIILKKINKDKKATIPFQIQVIEPDYIDDRMLYQRLPNGSVVMNGVQYDKDGRLEGYWLYRSHPGDPYVVSVASDFYPVRDVIHIFFKERPGQHRGVPFGACSFIRSRDLDVFEDAEMIKQQISACMAAFITNGSDNTLAGMPNTATPTGPNIERLEPGTVQRLAYGEQITFSNPPTKEGYAEYVKTQKRGIASGYGTTYEAMTGDLSNVNFSSGRMGWLEFHREIVDWQENMLIPMLCHRVWDWFIDGCIIQGIVRNREAAQWTAPRREMIDPVKETSGLSLLVRNGFKSAPEVIRSLGYEPDDVLAEMQEWNKKTDDAKLQLDSNPAYDKTKVKPEINDAELSS